MVSGAASKAQGEGSDGPHDLRATNMVTAAARDAAANRTRPRDRRLAEGLRQRTHTYRNSSVRNPTTTIHAGQGVHWSLFPMQFLALAAL